METTAFEEEGLVPDSSQPTDKSVIEKNLTQSSDESEEEEEKDKIHDLKSSLEHNSLSAQLRPDEGHEKIKRRHTEADMMDKAVAKDKKKTQNSGASKFRKSLAAGLKRRISFMTPK